MAITLIPNDKKITRKKFKKIIKTKIPQIFENIHIKNHKRVSLKCLIKNSKKYQCTIPIQISTNNNFYGDTSKVNSINMTFKKFIHLFKKSLKNNNNKSLKTDNNNKNQLYLCQIPLYSVSRENRVLLPNIIKNKIKIIKRKNIISINLWMNIYEANTNLHFDDKNNLLCIISGCKEINLFPPSETRYISKSNFYQDSSNHSTIKNEQINHVGIKKYVAVIKSGQCLYIPEGWWHSVKSEKNTIAINYWFKGYSYKLKEKIQAINMSTYYARITMKNLFDLIMNKKIKIAKKNSKKLLKINKIDLNASYKKLLKIIRDESILCYTKNKKDLSLINALMQLLKFEQMEIILPKLNRKNVNDADIKSDDKTNKKLDLKCLEWIAFNISPITVEIILRKWEEFVNEPELWNEKRRENFYLSIFSRNSLIKDMLMSKREEFNKIICMDLFHNELGIDRIKN